MIDTKYLKPYGGSSAYRMLREEIQSIFNLSQTISHLSNHKNLEHRCLYLTIRYQSIDTLEKSQKPIFNRINRSLVGVEARGYQQPGLISFPDVDGSRSGHVAFSSSVGYHTHSLLFLPQEYMESGNHDHLEAQLYNVIGRTKGIDTGKNAINIRWYDSTIKPILSGMHYSEKACRSRDVERLASIRPYIFPFELAYGKGNESEKSQLVREANDVFNALIKQELFGGQGTSQLSILASERYGSIEDREERERMTINGLNHILTPELQKYRTHGFHDKESFDMQFYSMLSNRYCVIE